VARPLRSELVPGGQPFSGRLWLGGWSFVKLPIWLEGLFVLTLYAGLAAFLIQWIRRSHSGKRRYKTDSLPGGAFSFLDSGPDPRFLGGLHAIGHVLSWPDLSSHLRNPLDQCLVFPMALPPFFCVFFPLLSFVGPRLARWYALLVVILFLGIDLWGWFGKMVPYYTATTSSILSGTD